MAHAPLNVPHGMSLEQVLGVGSGPLEYSIAAIERLYQTDDKVSVRRAVEYIAPQHVCDNIIEHHGMGALDRVLCAIAKAASKHRVPMNARVRAKAGALGLDIY